MFNIKSKDNYSLNNQEHQITRNTIILPVLGIILLSIIATTIFLKNFKKYNEQILKDKKTTFINYKKDMIKQETDNIISYINYYKKNADLRLKKNLKAHIYEAEGIIRKHYNNNRKFLFEYLESTRFNDGRGYYILIDNKTKKFLIHPTKKGQDSRKVTLNNNSTTYKEISSLLKDKDEGFTEVYFTKPYESNGKLYKKIIFAKYLKEFDIYLFSGEYLEDIEYEIQNELLDRIRDIEYGKNGYFFVYQDKGEALVLPNNPSLEGTNLYNAKSSDGVHYVKNLIYNAENKIDDFVFSIQAKPHSDIKVEKLSFAKEIEEWGWIVGTGAYVDDIEEELKYSQHLQTKEMDKYKFQFVLTGILAILLSIIFSLILSKKIRGIFNKYRKQLKEKNKKLVELNQSLETRVKEEVEKNRKKDELLIKQSKLAIMGEMLTMISHQWRQPLNVIGLIVQELEDAHQYGELDEKYIHETISSVMNQLNYLSGTINDFSNFFQPNKIPTTVNLNYVVNKSLELANSKITETGTKIDIKCDCKHPVEIYTNEIIQVILNILNNAMDEFTNKKIQNPLVTFESKSDDEFQYIVISDNAGGIAEEIMEKIFEPYFSTKEKNGTGLGLYMSKVVVESHMGGSLTVSNVESGASFCIKIPIKLPK